jgi:hypothetical protein
MGKIDDMRRLREQQFAETAARRAKGRANGAAQEPSERRTGAAADTHEVSEPETSRAQAVSTTPVGASSTPAGSKKPDTLTSRATTDAKAKCPECGKLRRVTNGAFASHQKGFGKACPGSRKTPA